MILKGKIFILAFMMMLLSGCVPKADPVESEN